MLLKNALKNALKNYFKNASKNALLAITFILSFYAQNSHAADWAILDGEVKTIDAEPTSITSNILENKRTIKNTENFKNQSAKISIQQPLVELDLDSITQMAHISKAWVRISHVKPQTILVEATKTEKTSRSMMYRILFDCINARYVYANTLAYTDIQGRGEIIGRNKISEREAIMQMKDIAPDSIAARIFKYSCQAPAKIFQ